MVACQSPEATARDVIAAGNGAITSAQHQYLDSCRAQPSADPCVLINKAVAAQALAVDTLHAYCSSPGYDNNNGPCEPHSALEGKLRTATSRLGEMTKQVKELLR